MSTIIIDNIQYEPVTLVAGLNHIVYGDENNLIPVTLDTDLYTIKIVNNVPDSVARIGTLREIRGASRDTRVITPSGTDLGDVSIVKLYIRKPSATNGGKRKRRRSTKGGSSETRLLTKKNKRKTRKNKTRYSR